MCGFVRPHTHNLDAVCLSVSALTEDFRAKGLYIGGMWEIRECSGIFMFCIFLAAEWMVGLTVGFAFSVRDPYKE